MRCFLLLFIFFTSGHLYAQKNDYIWLEGFGSAYPNLYDTATAGFTVGNIKLDFNQTPVQITRDSIGMSFDRTNTTMCDSNGNLLFYTNGIYVANALDKTIENGDSLNTGYVSLVWDPSIATDGYRMPQGIISIQDVANPNQYYLVSGFVDTVPNTYRGYVYGARVLVALIDMAANGGLGKVVYKNRTLIQDTICNTIQCVRHGNGRDWWLLIQKQSTNCFYRVLLDSAGFHVMPDMACLGDRMPFLQSDAACFSPDGTKYAYLGAWSGLNIYDFDRCTGLLSNLKHINTDSLVGGVAISPNNRFLYASVTYHLYQFDLWSNDIFSTIDTVGFYNGTHLSHNPGVLSVFATQQLAPDGKIYMSCDNRLPYYHVINNPDEKGALCNFVQNQVVLPNFALVAAVPNYPNYRLGSLTQSQCDSLTTFTQNIRDAKEQILKIFPNPAVDMVTVDYGFTDWNKGAVSLEIRDNLGQAVYTQPLPMYSGFQRLDISRFAAGMYTVYIKRSNAVVATQKMVKG